MKLLRIALCSYLLLGGLLAISQPSAVLAQNETPSEEEVKISAKYSKVEIISGEIAEFEVELVYQGEIGGESRNFDLVATGPKDWYVEITPTYPRDTRIADILLRPGYTVGEKIMVVTAPAYMPEPGEYIITLEVISEEIKGTFELTVVVTARYSLALVPATERYNTSATAGKDNYFSIEVWNLGTAAIDNVTFSSLKPTGWTIDFSPYKVDLLAPGDSQTIDVNIKPPPKTILGLQWRRLQSGGGLGLESLCWSSLA